MGNGKQLRDVIVIRRNNSAELENLSKGVKALWQNCQINSTGSALSHISASM